MTSTDALRILGLIASYTEEELTKAWRSMAMRYHPDRGGKHEKFVQIKEAYEFLKKHGPGKLEVKGFYSKRCWECAGNGHILVIPNAFRVIREKCKACNGKGRI